MTIKGRYGGIQFKLWPEEMVCFKYLVMNKVCIRNTLKQNLSVSVKGLEW